MVEKAERDELFTKVKRLAASWAKSVSATKNPGLETEDDVPDASVAFVPGSCDSDPFLGTSVLRLLPSSFKFPPSISPAPPDLAIIRNRVINKPLSFELPCLCIKQIRMQT